MKKLIIALLALAVLGGGTVGIFWWMKIGPFASAKDAGQTAEGAAVETRKDGSQGGSMFDKDAPVFYPLDPLVVPIFGEDGVSATIQIQVKLEVVGKENREKVSHLRPKISDSLLRDLYAFLPRLIKTQGRLDVTILKQRMQLVVDRAIGKGLVKEVLVQSVSDQAAK